MDFWYFGYGSNMDLNSLRAKGVEPRISKRAVLRGWRLRFNVRHFFRHEGGVGNIEPSDHPSDVVWGVLHRCESAHLALLDAAEAYGHGYDRTQVAVHTDRGERPAVAYVGNPSFLDESCRPTRRYLNIILRGATAAGLDPAVIESLRRHPVHEATPVPPFVPPAGEYRTFTAATLSQHPLLTALSGAVFDMSCARSQHGFLRGLFGGKDMTLFHLKRLDDSDGRETLDDIKHGRLTPAQRRYLNEYLHEYGKEYVYVGRYMYD
jgi:sulfite reductase (NADPH) flavoprotein alpha-component